MYLYLYIFIQKDTLSYWPKLNQSFIWLIRLFWLLIHFLHETQQICSTVYSLSLVWCENITFLWPFISCTVKKNDNCFTFNRKNDKIEQYYLSISHSYRDSKKPLVVGGVLRWLLFPSLFVYVFPVFIVMCIGSVTAGVPFHPKVISLSRIGLQTALRCCKTRADKKRGRESGNGSRANYSPKKTKGYISMIPPAVLFMSCVLSLCDLHPHTCPL